MNKLSRIIFVGALVLIGTQSFANEWGACSITSSTAYRPSKTTCIDDTTETTCLSLAELEYRNTERELKNKANKLINIDYKFFKGQRCR